MAETTDLSFIASTKINIYPCAYRGNSTTGYDAEARMNTEKNLTNTIVSLTSTGCFVISYDESTKTIDFVIGGYRVKANLSNILPTSYNDTYGPAGHVYARIELRSKDVAAGSGSSAYSTECLKNMVSGDSDFMDGPNELFQAIKFQMVPFNSDPTSPTNGYKMPILIYLGNPVVPSNYIYSKAISYRLDASDIKGTGDTGSILKKFSTETLKANEVAASKITVDTIAGDTIAGGKILLDSDSYINNPLNKVNALSRWTTITLHMGGGSPAGYAQQYYAAQIRDFSINSFPFNVMFRIWYDNGEGGVILNLGVMTLCYRQQVLSIGAEFVLASKDCNGNNIILSVLARNNGMSDLRVQSEFDFGNTVTVEYCII